MTHWVLLASLTLPNSHGAALRTSKHVRSAEPAIRDLIVDGYARSATFRDLVDTVERRPCVVYVASAVKLSEGMRGALLHSPAGLSEMRVLRVLLKANLSRDEAIATIGHELQHVVEFSSNWPATAGVSMAAVFDSLDPSALKSGARKYETQGAIAVAVRIRQELRRAARLD